MINLLPTHIKEERKYGRLNLIIAKQLIGIVLIGAFAATVMLLGLRLTKTDQEFLDGSIAIKSTAYSEVRPYEEQANKLRAKVQNIAKIFDQEVKFSKLLVDIASAIPVGSQLTDLALTGTSTEPLQITAEVNTQELAAVLRKNLVDSGIFESADIQSVSLLTGEEGEADLYSAAITASLSGSAEKLRAQAAAEKATAEAKAQAAAVTGEGQ